MSLGMLWNGVLPCGSTCDISWWRHHLGVFYRCFPKGYIWEVAEELETLTGLHPGWIHPGIVCCATFPVERRRIHAGVRSRTRISVLYSQPIPRSWEESCLCDFSVYTCLCRLLMDGLVFFLSNWKAIISKTYSKRWGKALGFSFHSCNL